MPKTIDPEKLPATLRPVAHKIEGFEDDRSNKNGYWVYLANGWQNAMDLGCHQIHEDNLKYCAWLVRKALPCNCADCLSRA